MYKKKQTTKEHLAKTMEIERKDKKTNGNIQKPWKPEGNRFFWVTVHSFQYSGVFAAFLLVFLGAFFLFTACVFLLVFVCFSLFLLVFVII